MNPATALVLGAFIASYAQNPNFQQSVNKAAQSLVGKGIDGLNSLNGLGKMVKNNDTESKAD